MSGAGLPDRIGPYAVTGKLGHGGMGVVYEVVEPGVQRRLALKLLTQLSNRDPAERSRLAREAEALARLSHPHVVRVHAAQLEGPRPYVVQELLAGGSLQGRLDRQGALPWEEAVGVVRKLAAGLAHAHAQGVLHRDLKPGNVLLDERGEPKLVDFGLAAVSGASSLTATGTALGTPAYMAPEQALGELTQDVRTDVYGLGALLYALLTSEPPFRRGSAATSLLAVVNDPVPDPRALRPDVPAWVAAVCRRALAKQPAERFPDARALGEALAFPTPRAGAPWGLLALAALALAALGASYAWATRAPTSPPEPTGPPSTPPLSPVAAAPAIGWDALEALLLEGRAAEALAALPPPEAAEANDRRRLRAWPLLLGGEVRAARDVRRKEFAERCELEQARLELQASVDAGPRGRGWPVQRPMDEVDFKQEDSPAWLDRALALARLAAEVPREDPLDALLLDRAGRTLGLALQACHPAALLRRRAEALALCDRAGASLPSSPDLDLARLLVCRELQGPPPAGIEPGDSWSQAQRSAWEGAWILVESDRIADRPKACLEVPAPPGLTWLQSEVLQDAQQALATFRLGELQRELEQQAPDWARALGHARAAVFHGRQQAELEQARTAFTDPVLDRRARHVIALLSLGDSARARALLEDGVHLPSQQMVQHHSLLLAECDLLDGEPGQALDRLDGVRLLRVEGQVDAYTARAAAWFARGDLARARGELEQAPESGGAYLPWRSLKLTELLLAGDDRRARLIEYARGAGQ